MGHLVTGLFNDGTFSDGAFYMGIIQLSNYSLPKVQALTAWLVCPSASQQLQLVGSDLQAAISALYHPLVIEGR